MHDIQWDLATHSVALAQDLPACIADDPLVPVRFPEGWDPEDPFGGFGFEDITAMLSALHEFNRLEWRICSTSGNINLPPWQHVLDERIRYLELIEDQILDLRPAAGTTALVHELPKCDGCDAEARFDVWGQGAPAHGIACFLCLECFLRETPGVVGPAHGGYLMLDIEVPLLVRRVCNELCRRQDQALAYPACDEDAQDPQPMMSAREEKAERQAVSVMRSVVEKLRIELKVAHKEIDAIAGEFKHENGKYVVTHTQHQAYKEAVRRATVLKQSIDELSQAMGS